MVVAYHQYWQEGTPRHVRLCAPVSRSKVKVTSSHRLYVSSLPLLHSGNKMQYLTHYRRAGAYRVGRTWRPHSLFRPTLPFSELTWLTNYCLSVLLVHLTDSAMLRHCASCKSTYYTRKIARQLRTQCRGHL